MIKALIVENDTELQDSMRKYLEFRGFEVDATFDAITGLAYAIERKYDVIYLDMNMYRLSWTDFIRELRMHKDTPVIAMTSKDILSRRMLDTKDVPQDILVMPYLTNEIDGKTACVLKAAGETETEEKYGLHLRGFDLFFGRNAKRITGVENHILSNMFAKETVPEEDLISPVADFEELTVYIDSINRKIEALGGSVMIRRRGDRYILEGSI